MDVDIPFLTDVTTLQENDNRRLFNSKITIYTTQRDTQIFKTCSKMMRSHLSLPHNVRTNKEPMGYEA